MRTEELSATISEYLSAPTEVTGARLAESCYLIARGVSYRFRWQTEDDREDAVQDCVVHLLRAAQLYEPERGKAFNYLTTCAFRCFYAWFRVKRERREVQLADWQE